LWGALGIVSLIAFFVARGPKFFSGMDVFQSVEGCIKNVFLKIKNVFENVLQK
jgi:hypothetical protein